LEPGLENYRRQCEEKQLPTTDEIAVLFAMFPQQVEALIKGTPAVENKPAPAPAAQPAATPAPAPAPAAPSGKNRQDMVLTINGQRHEVSIERLEA
jgi:hypothetical protein